MSNKQFFIPAQMAQVRSLDKRLIWIIFFPNINVLSFGSSIFFLSFTHNTYTINFYQNSIIQPAHVKLLKAKQEQAMLKPQNSKSSH